MLRVDEDTKEPTMHRRPTLITAVAASAVAAAALATAVPAASAATTAAATVRVVPVVMKDPGCHWFRVAGKDSIRLVVNGTTGIRNLDEATLVFQGPGATQRLAVGKTLTLAKRGVYHITMVKQAPHDNHLTLVVR
jgi:hypothetical protein